MGGGVREVFVLGDLRIRICFEQVELAVIRQPVVHSRVAAQAQVPINALREVFNLSLQLGRKVGGLGDKTNLLLIVRIPFEPAGGDIQSPIRQIGNDQLPGRVRLQFSITDNAHVDLTAFDELFRDGVA